MRISVVMATYNGARYCREQLQSLASQSRCPDELVVTDDCSPDDTVAIVEEFSRIAPFEVRCIRNEERLGSTGNFSAALEKATGDLVFLSDQDDVWFTRKIECMERVAKEAPQAQVLMCDAALADEDLNEMGLSKLGQLRSAGLSDCYFVMGCCIAARSSFLQQVLPIPATYTAHDEWLVRIAEGIGGKLVIDAILQLYRRHGENASDFVANKLVAVSRKDVWISRLQRITDYVRGAHNSNGRDPLRDARLLLSGVIRARERGCGALDADYADFEDRMKAYVAAMEARARIVQRARVRRPLKVAELWMKGGYQDFNGVVSALSDLLPPKKVE